ncbi:DUF3347 domain-containing protein [uncultured Dokdonia sp.]|uniref:DUF3347 domain-containing protein n=1 Tax=uncultured Dokdonia sp. TaxID=575653 RepID=UPI002615502E|nr:DUF3347 domain-containing protein [uncultured Dokdonia sp.]
MKKYIYLLAMIAFFSCKNKEAEVKTAPSQVADMPVVETTDLNETSSAVEVTFEDAGFTEIYNAYLDLKATLVNTDATKAQEAATIMLAKVGEKYKAADLVEALEKVSNTDAIKEQRMAFENVSMIVETLISENKITSGAVYKQYCPMAFNGKGAYWLSNSNEVRNPYFGDQMLKCGVVEEEIK